MSRKSDKMEAENTNNKMLNKEVQTFFQSPIEEFTLKIYQKPLI